MSDKQWFVEQARQKSDKLQLVGVIQLGDKLKFVGQAEPGSSLKRPAAVRSRKFVQQKLSILLTMRALFVSYAGANNSINTFGPAFSNPDPLS